MLSVVIETLDDEEGLARTLASLVPAAIEGVVREVIVRDLGSRDNTHRVAEHAGCSFLTDCGLVEALGRARGDWLLLVEPGARLVDGWIEPTVEHLATRTTPAQFSRARQQGRGPLLGGLLTRGRPLANGLLISKRQALSRNADSAERLARGLPTRKIGAEIFVASKPSR